MSKCTFCLILWPAKGSKRISYGETEAGGITGKSERLSLAVGTSLEEEGERDGDQGVEVLFGSLYRYPAGTNVRLSFSSRS